MLLLTRKLGESITIGDNIRVSVLGIRGRQVRIGIEAPSDTVVHREEIAIRIRQEAIAKSKPSPFVGAIDKVKKAFRTKTPDAPET